MLPIISYYSFPCSYQYPSVQLPFPLFLIGIQTQVHVQLQKIKSHDKLQQNEILPKKQQQEATIELGIEQRTQKRLCKPNKSLKAQEMPLNMTHPTPKKRREADSFTQRRNIIPNNINHILAFIQRKSKSGHLVRRIIQKSSQPSTFTVKNFYCYQTYLKQKLHIHVNKDTLGMIANHLELTEDIFSVEEQLFYNRVSRTLISYYIRQLAKIKILSSSRVKCTNKLDHLRAHRTLLQYLVGKSDQ